MPLQKSSLKSNLVSAFNDIKKNKHPGGPKLPKMSLFAATRLAKAYDDWVNSSVPLAGALTISVPGQPSLLAALLVAPLMAGWAPGLLAYWSPVMWAGAGFAPANPTIPAALAGIAPEMAAQMGNMASSIDDIADKIATILHKYTTQLQVTATTLAGVASTLPVT
jgi:hypothetical protein